MSTNLKCTSLACLLIAVSTVARAQEPPKPAQPAVAPAKAAEEWHTVSRGELKVEVELDAAFSAAEAAPVEVKTKVFGGQGLKVTQPVEQGTVVKKGDVLVKFSTEEIDKAIRDAEMAEAAAKLSLETAEKEMDWARKEADLDRNAAEAAVNRRQQDDARYEKVEKPLVKKNYAAMLERMQDSLEGQIEELKQLEKMYKEDDLTEETEEIILKRQKRAVKYAQLGLEQAEANYDDNMNIKLARTDEDRALAKAKTDIAHQRGLNQISSRLFGVTQSLAKARIAAEDASKKVAELKADRELFAVQSPAGGVVYFGKLEKGKWQEAAAVEQNMKVDGTLRANSVFLTVIENGPLVVYSVANEANVLKLSEGQSAVVIANADPFNPVKGKVRSVSQFPIGSHEVVTDLEGKPAAAIRPGMTGKVKVTTYNNGAALKAPLSAIKSDEPGVYHVFVQTADEGSEKRIIKVGQRTGQEAEILEGLSEGDKVKKNG